MKKKVVKKVPQINQILQLAIQQKASDIHLSSQEPIRLRINGDLIAINQNILTHQQLTLILFEILTDEEKKKISQKWNLDRSYTAKGIGNFRVNIFMTKRGIASSIRVIPEKIPSISELGFPSIVYGLSELNKGLVLVTGPTGSGKSTTLAAMIDHINTNFHCHILTIEDPIEFIHVSKKSLVNQREIGNSCPTFSDALKYALREDPNVILVGEMRDLETISLAITAAETGHLVFGTLHTRNAASSVDRIIDSFPAEQQPMIRVMLSESLRGVISQTLVKKKDGSGRVAIFEIMTVNHAISNLIREGKTFQIDSVMQTSRQEGMVLMENVLNEYIKNGVISNEEAEDVFQKRNFSKLTKKQARRIDETDNIPMPNIKPKSNPPKPLTIGEKTQFEIELKKLEKEKSGMFSSGTKSDTKKIVPPPLFKKTG